MYVAFTSYHVKGSNLAPPPTKGNERPITFRLTFRLWYIQLFRNINVVFGHVVQEEICKLHICKLQISSKSSESKRGAETKSLSLSL